MDRPEVRDLEYVVALGEELSFTRAAARMGIAQPPLSRAISRLERRLGVALFTRNSRSVQVTAAGAAFIKDSRAVLGSLDAMVRRAHPDRQLVVAVRPATGSGLLGEILERCAALPEPLAVQIRFTGTPAADVRAGLADAALTCRTQDTTGLRTEELDDQPTVALLALHHRLGNRIALTTGDLLADPGFLGECPETSFDEMIGLIALQGASLLASQDVADRIGNQVRAIRVTDAPLTTLSLSWLEHSGHPRLPVLIQMARHTAYARGDQFRAS